MITEEEFDFSKIKVKQEKRTPSPTSKPRTEETKDAIKDVIDKIVPNLFSSPQKDGIPTEDNVADESLVDEKKSVEPVKSSNEILTELFKVFNAAPPETLLNDDYLLHKKKKKSHSRDESNNKEKKHKKKKHRKSSSDEAGGKGDDLLCDKERSKHKKKKKKKSKKHSKSNGSEKTKSIDEKKHNKTGNDNIKTTRVKIENEEIQNGRRNYESDFTISDEDDYQRPLLEEPIVDISIVKKEEQKQSDRSENTTSKISNSSINKLKPPQLKIKLNIKDSTILRKVERAKFDPIEDDQFYRRDFKKEDTSSEITLSDEDEYLNERDDTYIRNYSHDERSRHRDRSSAKHSSSRNSSTRYRHRSRDRFDNSWRRSRSRSRYRRRSRSRSRSRSRNLGIDKKRLLEIARKNAITMFKNGSLPGTMNLTQEAKDKVVMRMRYGGKTVEELTEFCKRLSKGESVNDFSSLSSNDDSDHDKDGNEKVFHHPFVLKDRGPIVMNIKNAVPKPPKTAEQSKAIAQYPVSSGQQHRMIESEWVPVPKKPEAPPAAPAQPAPASNKPSVPKNVFEKPLPNAQQEPAFVLPSAAGSSTTTTTTTTTTETAPVTSDNTTTMPVETPTTNSTSVHTPIVAPSPPLPVPPVSTNNVGNLNNPSISNINTMPLGPTNSSMTAPIEPAPIAPSHNDSIFPQINPNIDVSSIISQRLNAMRKLQDNPTDPEALKMMYDSQKGMTLWATSKFTPGQFTGSTGANVLTPKELTSGQQAWAKRDQLTNSVPVAGGIGMHLLQKMGWRPGEGLGKERKGSLQPLLLELKFDKRGLVANEEDSVKNRMRRRRMQPQQHQQHAPLQPPPEPPMLPVITEVMDGKHPVSLLGEIASKRRWGPPYYEVFEEKGPAHNKKFIFRVTVNDMVYQPTIHCGNKKQAKALAAKYCLQQMGVLSPNS